jgi:hypothetical protein
MTPICWSKKVLLVRVANWRMLATRDAKGFATFKASVGKAQAQVAVLESLDLSPELAGMQATVKSGIVKYAEAFDKTGPDLVRGDELYYKSITRVIVDAIGQMDQTKEAIGKAFDKTTPKPRISSPRPSQPCRRLRPSSKLRRAR